MLQYGLRSLLVVWAGFFIFSFDVSAGILAPDTSRTESHALEYLTERVYDSAELLYQEAGSEYAARQDTAGIVRAAIGHSKALIRQRSYDQALATLTTDLGFPPDLIADEFLRVKLYERISDVHYYKYDAFSALENYTHYYNWLKEHEPGSSALMEASRAMTIYHLNAGLMTMARTYAREYKTLAAEVDGALSEGSADASNFLGMLSRYIGEPHVALVNYEQALTIAKALNEEGAGLPSNILLSNIGMLYMNELDDPDKALNYFRRSKAFLMENGQNPYDLGQIESKFARYFASRQQYDSAYYYIDRSMAILRGADRAEMSLYGKYAMKAEFLYDQQRYQEALQQLEAGTRYRYQAIPGNTTYNWATDYHKGKVWLAMGQPDSALHYFSSALVSYLPDAPPAPGKVPAYTEDHPEKLMITKILHGKARAYQALSAQGQPEWSDRAFAHYQGLLDWLYKIRSSFVYGESRVYISENMQEIIDEALALAYAAYKETADEQYLSFIHHTIESNKWVSLKEELLTSQARMPESFALAQRLEFLKKRVNFFNKQLAENSLTKEDSLNLLARRLGLEQEITQINQQHQLLTNTVPISLSALRKDHLKDGEVLSEFLLGDSHLHQMLITRDTTLYLAHKDPQAREEEVNQLRQAIRQGQAEPFNELAYRLYQRYVAPVAELPGFTLRQQRIIPDAFINNIPFDALVTALPDDIKQFPANGFLIQSVNTRKQFMVTGTPAAARPASARGQVLAFSPNFTRENIQAVHERAGESLVNLPYAVEECRSLVTRFDGAFYEGEAATETSFKEVSGQASIIHLATHAILEENVPDQSRLLLFADSVNDGMLHAYEINALNIDSELVALSACNTGMGEYRTGEGNMSLARGFYLAGTRSVLMSLWTVDDNSTATLMKNFYAYLEKGHTKDDALSHAKLDMIREADNIHRNPYYWAGFDLVGDTTPIPQPSRFPWLPLVLVISGLAIVGGFIRKRRTSRG